MSIKLMSKAWDLIIPQGPKFILVSLCDYANDDGVCWPGQDTLSIRCSMHEDTVGRHIAWLESRGYLKAERRQKGQRRLADCYFIDINGGQNSADPEPDNLQPCKLPDSKNDVGILQITPREPDNLRGSFNEEPPMNPQYKKQEVYSNDVETLSRGRTGEGVSSSVPSAVDPIHSRAVEIAVMLRQRGASLQASNPYVRQWATDGATDAQLLTALETAERQRHANASNQPVNAGYLNSILSSVCRPPERRKTAAEASMAAMSGIYAAAGFDFSSGRDDVIEGRCDVIE